MNAQTKAKRITLIGGPACGKTTLAHDLFVQFKKLGKNVEIIPEWIRRDIMRNGPMDSVFEQYRTLMNHRREEENFPKEVEYLIHDGGTLTPYFYAALYSKKTDRKERLVVQDMYEALLDDLYSFKYDKIYFLPRAIADAAGVSFQDGVRYQTEHDLEVLETYMRLIFTKIHQMGNIKVLDCPLKLRTMTLIRDILGNEAVQQWSALDVIA
jgi:hypothetical protein